MLFSYGTTILLDDALAKKGIFRNKRIMDTDYCYFSWKELEEIDVLEVTNISNIDEISKLPNLKKLIIKSENRDRIYNDDIPLELNTLINHIKDFKKIGRIKSLETLIIDNDIYLTSLDITNLTNLKELVLTNNPNFTKIVGLDQLTKLEKVIIYGNDLKGDLDIEKYMANTTSTSPNILDIKLYSNMVKNNPRLARKLSDYFLLGLTYVKFAEKNGFMKLTILNNDNLEEMFTKLNVYFRRMKAYQMTDVDKIKLIYKYVYQNVEFAKKELIERQRLYLSYIQKKEPIPPYLEKYFASLHSSYNAYHFKTANCEGAANLMGFMCDMLEIESTTVHCIDKRSGQIDGTNHAMLRVKIDGKYYYLDPTFSLTNPENYFLVDIDRVMEDHQISTYEKQICKKNKVYEYQRRNRKMIPNDGDNK